MHRILDKDAVTTIQCKTINTELCCCLSDSGIVDFDDTFCPHGINAFIL